MAEDNCNPTMTVTEPDFFEYTAWAFDHREELRSALREAGASEYLIRFIDTVHRGTRHSVLMTLFRHHGSSVATAGEARAPNAEDCAVAGEACGGFMAALWKGHLADAYTRADGNNRTMMEEAFSMEEVITVGLTSDGPFRVESYLRQLVSERWGR